MKRIIFFAVCLMMLHSISFGARAKYALDKGSTMLGLNAGFLSARGELYESPDKKAFTALLISHQIAYFAWPRVALGGDLLILLTRYGAGNSTTLGWGPRIMYFLSSRGKKTHPFVTSGFYLVKNEVEYSGFWNASYSGTRFKLGAGSSVMLSRHLSLLMEASYNLDKLKSEGDGKSESGEMVIFTMGLAGFLF